MEVSNVMPTEKRITAKNSPAPSSRRPGPRVFPRKNREISATSVGKRPLQGTRELVSWAVSRSRGESIMRQPVTPQALQPKPMHMVRLCRP